MPPFITKLRVSWVDTDAAQIVHFSNYLRFFEKAEEEFYRSIGLNFEAIAEKYGLLLPRVEAFCRYMAPSRFNDLLEIRLSIKELGKKSIKYGFKVYNANSGRQVAEGYIVVVATDEKIEKAAELPKEFVEKLTPFVET